MSDLTPKVLKPTPFLTVIPQRQPQQKAHTSKGLAISALKYDKGREGAVYEMKEGEWVLLHTVTPQREDRGYGWYPYTQIWEPPLPE